jgi:hypothetical protein
MPLRRTYACLSLDTPSQFSLNLHDTSALSVPSAPSPTSESAFQQFQPKVGKPIVKLPSTSSRFHDTTSALSVPSVPSPTSALQPKVGKPIVKLPSTSRFQSSLLSPRRQSPFHHRSLHLDCQIFPHFKPGLNLYRHVLRRKFLRATKNAGKATMNNMEAPTTRHNNDQ